MLQMTLNDAWHRTCAGRGSVEWTIRPSVPLSCSTVQLRELSDTPESWWWTSHHVGRVTVPIKTQTSSCYEKPSSFCFTLETAMSSIYKWDAIRSHVAMSLLKLYALFLMIFLFSMLGSPKRPEVFNQKNINGTTPWVVVDRWKSIIFIGCQYKTISYSIDNILGQVLLYIYTSRDLIMSHCWKVIVPRLSPSCVHLSQLYLIISLDLVCLVSGLGSSWLYCVCLASDKCCSEWGDAWSDTRGLY